MTSGRLEAFSDGVVAILITIMVLELHAPDGSDLDALREVLPTFLIYVLSFVFLAIYWNNHHHLLHVTQRINGTILWANMHLLFWLSLVPFATGWLGRTDAAAVPTALYGVVLLAASIAYFVLERAIVAVEGPDSRLRAAVGKEVKGLISTVLYAVAVGAAFLHRGFSIAIYVVVALMWLVPDRRIEGQLREAQG